MTTTRTPASDLAACIDANRPALLMGAPGTAKTATIEAIAAARGAYLEVLIASAQDPTTILGIPMPTEDRKYTEPTMPGWARRINEAHAQGKATILFLDELTTVPPSVAAPLLGIVQSRRSDGWTIPAETRIVAAANPPDLAVGGWAVEPAMANRWVHINWPAPTADWVAWAGAQSSPALRTIAEYIAAVPGELLNVPTDIRKRSGAWASPRSWTNAAALIDATGDPTLAALAVGDAAAATFAAWLSTRDVPTVEAMLNGAPLPQRHDAFVTALDSLVRAATGETLDATIAILRGALATDPAVVAIATRTLASAGHIAGIASLVADLESAGIDFGSVA
jgi:MoxR-like ATPase